MSQQSLFPDREHQREKAHTDRVREDELGDGPDPDRSDVADYIDRQDRQEIEERQRNDTLHARAYQQVNKVAVLRWAINADDPDIPSECRKAAMRAKRRLDTLAEARCQDLTPSDPGFIPLRDNNADLDRWPFDDDPMEIPSSSTSRTDYEGYLADTFVSDWRHVIPTHVIREAKQADPAFL